MVGLATALGPLGGLARLPGLNANAPARGGGTPTPPAGKKFLTETRNGVLTYLTETVNGTVDDLTEAA